jgi:hypothetical protein
VAEWTSLDLSSTDSRDLVLCDHENKSGFSNFVHFLRQLNNYRFLEISLSVEVS